MTAVECPQCKSVDSIEYHGVIEVTEDDQWGHPWTRIKLIFTCHGMMGGCGSMFYVIFNSYVRECTRGVYSVTRVVGKLETDHEDPTRNELVLGDDYHEKKL